VVVLDAAAVLPFSCSATKFEIGGQWLSTHSSACEGLATQCAHQE
jgi:hypothetical protein